MLKSSDSSQIDFYINKHNLYYTYEILPSTSGENTVIKVNNTMVNDGSLTDITLDMIQIK